MTKESAISFRERYLDYAELTHQLRAWEKAHPDLVRIRSLGSSPGGRDLWLLIIGRSPDEQRPAVWVDANMHASELCGSSVALGIAEDVLALHKTGQARRLPAPVADAAREALFYILPRMSPDGAEAVLRTGRYIRSSPEDRRQKNHAHWQAEDVDGDGHIACMRQVSPGGELVELPGAPGVLVPRQVDDVGPFYKLYPEGRIVNFDGRRIPDPHFLSDNHVDFNRNFPFMWAPEPEQEGAGDYPGSAPETRAVMDFMSSHPNVFAWLNLHTFGGVFIRPLGDKPDSKMDQGDLAVFRQVEQWASEHTGYPTVSGFHEFCYEPDKPLRGDLTEYAYNQRGCIAYVVELWDLFHQLGIERRRPFVDHYTHLDRSDYLALARWDREQNQGRIFRPWRPCKHPQLGDVEVGGMDLRIGITNPPYERLNEVCRAQSDAFLRVAALLPRVSLEVVRHEALAGGLTRVEVRVRNAGYLGTYGLPSAKKLPISEPLRLTALPSGCSLKAPGEAVVEVGHLEGWGQGRFAASLFTPWTRGNVQERFVTFVTQGQGHLDLTVGCGRVGEVKLRVPVG